MPYNGVDPLNNRGQLIEKIDPQPFLRHFGDQVRSPECRDRSGIEPADQIQISG
jgi:hypothetical protein